MLITYHASKNDKNTAYHIFARTTFQSIFPFTYVWLLCALWFHKNTNSISTHDSEPLAVFFFFLASFVIYLHYQIRSIAAGENEHKRTKKNAKQMGVAVPSYVATVSHQFWIYWSCQSQYQVFHDSPHSQQHLAAWIPCLGQAEIVFGVTDASASLFLFKKNGLFCNTDGPL